MEGKGVEVAVADAEVLVAAPPSTVWRALVDAEHRSRWWSYLELHPEIGAGFTERWTGADGEERMTTGSVVDVSPDRLLRLTWSDVGWPAETEVEITMGPTPAGTVVRVRHAGFERLPEGHRIAHEHAAGWRMHLSHLRSFIEGEPPVR